MMVPGTGVILEIATLMGAKDSVLVKSAAYIQIRLWGAPSVLVSLEVLLDHNILYVYSIGYH